MLIVGDNLKELIKKYNILNNEKRYDKTCLTLTLSEKIVKYNVPEDCKIIYGEESLKKYAQSDTIDYRNGYVLKPHECILACSNEKIKMPNFCFGILQTKGSLARLFISLNCTDAQIDPGYEGKITFEICNLSNFDIVLKRNKEVEIYIFLKQLHQQKHIQENIKMQNSQLLVLINCFAVNN